MTYRELETVVLTRDLPQHGLRGGDLGTIVHVHSDDAFEIEFVRASGKTQALVTLSNADIRGIRDQDLVAVRTVGPSSQGAA